MSLIDTETAGAVPAEAEVPVLDVRDLRVEFRLRLGTVKAVAGLTYSVGQGETLAIVGESGSGKSVAARAVLGVNPPRAKVTDGHAMLLGEDLLSASDSRMRELRGAKIAMVAQNASLNPTFTVGWQIAEPLRVHLGLSRRDAMTRAAELMDRVGIPDARSKLRNYPYQFSGGMRQRVSIAMAMALEPAVLIADEPTTALDVTVQAQIMALLADMQSETGMALVLITHDLGLVAEHADRVVVMYAGREFETGRIESVFTRPAHPYTLSLLRSAPDVDNKVDRLTPIAGSPPDLMRVPAGCPFHPRCDLATADCSVELPLPRQVAPGRWSSCHKADEVFGDDDDD